MIGVLFGILMVLIVWKIGEGLSEAIEKGFKSAQNNFTVNLDSRFGDYVRNDLQQMALKELGNVSTNLKETIKNEAKKVKKAEHMRKKRAEAKAKNQGVPFKPFNELKKTTTESPVKRTRKPRSKIV